MNKSFLIAVSVAAAVVVGYIVYMSYFTVKTTVVTDSGASVIEVNTQPFVMPETEEEKLNALDNLTSSADASANTASESEKAEVLNSAAGSPKSDTIPAGDAEKIKLLESLKN